MYRPGYLLSPEYYAVVTRWSSGCGQCVASHRDLRAANTLLGEYVDYYVSEGLMRGDA